MSAGAIRFDGRRIDALASARRVALGIAHVPEGRQIFPALTVAENLRLGGYAAARPRDIAEVCAPFPVLIERQDQIAANLLQDRINEIVNEHLSETCRSVYVLSRVEGRKNGEIADLPQISVKSVENQLYHALKVLRRKLAPYQ